MNAAQSENVRRPSGNASEGLLVQRAWNYVMNIIYHNPGKVVRVPSSRQLAEILGISRSTVNQAFEKLLDAEYIITRQGSGTYTNPHRSFFPEQGHPPLIGICFYEGDAFYYTGSSWRIISSLGSCLGERGYNIRLHQNGIAGKIQTDQMLQFSWLDALVSFKGKYAELLKLAEKIPVVAIGNMPYPGLPSVFLREEMIVAEVAKLCRKETCSECLLLRAETPDDVLHLLGERLLAENAEMKILEVNVKEDGFEERLRKLVNREKRVLLIHYNQYTRLVQEIRAEYPESVVTLSYDHPLHREVYHGYSVDFPWKKVAESAVSLLQEVMTDPACDRRIVCAPEILHWE